MVDSRAMLFAAAMAAYAAPALAHDGDCEGCAAPQAWPPAVSAEPAPYAPPLRPEVRYERRSEVVREESVTRVSYAEGYLNWPGKDAGGPGPQDGPGYGPGPYDRAQPPCPPVRPGERVLSCKFVPFAQRAPQAEEAPISSVLYAEGGVGPDYIPEGGGGGGGTTIIEGGSGNSSSSAYASASASANVSTSITIDEHQHEHEHDHEHQKGGGGGSWGGGGSNGGGSWGQGSMGGGSQGGGSWGGGSMSGGHSGGGSWGQGSMSGGGGSWSGGGMASNSQHGSWPSGGGAMGSWSSGGVGHSMGHASSGHGVSHGHGRK